MRLYGGYVRVSRVGDRADTIKSPEVQERANKRKAKSAGVAVEPLPHELDRSGADNSRPVFLSAVERIERGELAGLIVYRFDRFGRTLLDSLKMIKRIEEAGGEVLSATEPNGSSLQRNITLAIAEEERERLSAGFERSKADAIAEGIYIGRPPIGYVKGPDRKLRRDPKTWRVVREAFKRRARGDSWRSVAGYMGGRLGRGRLPASVRAMIRNPAYLGIARQGKHVNENAHDPIVDRATWEAAQLDHPRPPRGKHGTGLLVGLVRCAGCSKRMTSSVTRDGRIYRCRRHHAGGECPEPAIIMAPQVEPYVTAAVLSHLRDANVTYKPRTDALAAAQAALEDAERRRDELHRAHDIAEVGAEHFAAAMRDAVAEVDARRRELAEASSVVPEVPGPEDAAAVLDQLNPDELRHLLGRVLGVVWISRGKGPGRVRVVVRGFEPDDLSTRGIPSGPPVRAAIGEADLDGEIRPPAGENLG